MIPHLFQRFIIQTSLAAIFCVLPCCTAAHPEEITTTEVNHNSTPQHKIQLKQRPTYITPQVEEQLRIRTFLQTNRHPAPKLKRTFFITPNESNLAFSIGDTRDGYLINGQSLPAPSTILRQLPVQYERGITYGTHNLIAILTDTARAMQKKYPHTIMYLGNMGAREGGDIPYSVSHNSGRDADIAFYYTDEKGKFAHPQNLYKITRGLKAFTKQGTLTFDLEKNTTLIETLLTHPKIHLQFIFLAKYIRTAVHKELIRRGASEDLLKRFEETVQAQAAHNDHFHIRIYCSNEDICAGCIDKSIIHEWQEDPLPKRDKCIQNHLKTLSSKKSDADHKAAALQRLALMGAAVEHGSKILKFLQDENPHVRAAAAIAAQSMDANAAKALSAQLQKETDQSVRLAIIQSLGSIESAETRQTFNEELHALSAGQRSYMPTEALQAITSYIIHHPNAEHMRPLHEALQSASSSGKTTGPLLRAFNVVTNRNFCHDGGLNAACMEKISTWIEKQGNKSRQQWLIAGFQASGFKVTNLEQKDIPVLLDAIDGSYPLSINAQLILKKIGHLEQDSLNWAVQDSRWHYTRYFKRRAKKYKINLNDRDEKGNKL